METVEDNARRPADLSMDGATRRLWSALWHAVTALSLIEHRVVGFVVDDALSLNVFIVVNVQDIDTTLVCPRSSANR